MARQRKKTVIKRERIQEIVLTGFVTIFTALIVWFFTSRKSISNLTESASTRNPGDVEKRIIYSVGRIEPNILSEEYLKALEPDTALVIQNDEFQPEDIYARQLTKSEEYTLSHIKANRRIGGVLIKFKHNDRESYVFAKKIKFYLGVDDKYKLDPGFINPGKGRFDIQIGDGGPGEMLPCVILILDK